MAGDVFPPTMSTWIVEEARRGPEGRLSINKYLMSTYAWPLRVYYLGTNSTWLGEADDVINGFFANRLAREEFIDKWMASGMRLRRWLMNAFCFYLKELRRATLLRRPATGTDFDGPVTFTGDPDAATDRAAAVSFVRQAMSEAQQACDAEGLEAHWRAFLRHHLHGASFREIALEFDVDPARAAVMSRTAARKFRAALHEVLLRDGAAPAEIDREIHKLLEVSGR